MQKSKNGFTLIELMIVVSIISILAVIAVPSYLKHMQRSHRSDAMSALMRIAADQEKFYFQNSRYGSMVELGRPQTEHGWYMVFIWGNSDRGYTTMAFAHPSGPQWDDTNCRRFMMNQSGERLAWSASNQLRDDCWR